MSEAFRPRGYCRRTPGERAEIDPHMRRTEEAKPRDDAEVFRTSEAVKRLRRPTIEGLEQGGMGYTNW